MFFFRHYRNLWIVIALSAWSAGSSDQMNFV